MRKLLLTLGVSITVLLAGCGDDVDLEASIAEKNIKVDTALSRHKVALKESDELKELFTNYMLTQDESELRSFLNSKIKNNDTLGYTSTFSYLKDSYYEYVSLYNKMAEQDDTGSRKKILDNEKYLKDHLLIESFLNASKATTEQLFYLTLEDSESLWVSVYWVGGNIIDIKTSRSL